MGDKDAGFVLFFICFLLLANWLESKSRENDLRIEREIRARQYREERAREEARERYYEWVEDENMKVDEKAREEYQRVMTPEPLIEDGGRP